MRKIMNDLRIIARDQNKVFVVLARARKLSPADAKDRYGLRLGKARAYVEFDVEDDELGAQYNGREQREELFIVGDVELARRNPQSFLNF